MRPLWMTALALLAVAAFPRPASAIPVIYGSGDTVAHVADLPPDSPARLPGKFVWGGNPTKVGYKYYRFHIFWMPVWTSTTAGEFVAYDEIGFGGTSYLPLGTNPHEVSAKTWVPVSRLTVPWSARLPWGLLVGPFVLWLLYLLIAAWWTPPVFHCPSCKSRLDVTEALYGPTGAKCPRCDSQVLLGKGGKDVVAVPARMGLPMRHPAPREGLIAESGADKTGGTPGQVTTTFELHVFVEEADRLLIRWSVWEQAAQVGCSTVPLLLVGGAWFALGGTQDPAQVWGWLSAAGAVAVLGCLLIGWILYRGRTVWVLDRRSGQLFHRGKPLRALSSITHIAIYGVTVNGDPCYFVGFAPKLDSFAATIGARVFRKDIMCFDKQEKAWAAASHLAAFLKVRVVLELLE